MTPNWVCIPCFWERRISRHLSFTGLLIVPSTKNFFPLFTFFLITFPSNNHFFYFESIDPSDPAVAAALWTILDQPTGLRRCSPEPPGLALWTPPPLPGPSRTSSPHLVAAVSSHFWPAVTTSYVSVLNSPGRLDPNYIGPLPTRNPLFIG